MHGVGGTPIADSVAIDSLRMIFPVKTMGGLMDVISLSADQAARGRKPHRQWSPATSVCGKSCDDC